MVPVAAPVGTVAVIWVLEFTTKLAFLLLKNLTTVAPVKLDPVITTVVPTGPVLGLRLEITGGRARTVKLLLLVAVSRGVVTVIAPVVAPVGTVAVIWIASDNFAA
jgi:hypothetical protein